MRGCAIHGHPNNYKGGHLVPSSTKLQKIWPLRNDTRERLIDEAVVGFLSCMRGKPIGNLRFQVFNPSEVIDGIGSLALAEINARLGRKKPLYLNETEYSQDIDECRMQVILNWMQIMDIRDPEFANLLSSLFFEKQWKEHCKGLLNGIATALSRNNREMLITRARQECQQLSPTGTAIISYLASGISKKPAHLEPIAATAPKEGPPIGSPEWRNMHALCFASPKALLDVVSYIEARTSSWFKSIRINPENWAKICEGDSTGLITQLTLDLEFKVYAYITVITVATILESRFWDCKVHKEIEQTFFRENGTMLGMTAFNEAIISGSETMELPLNEKDPTESFAKLAVKMLTKIRRTAWNYAMQSKFAAASVTSLFDTTAILRLLSRVPSLQKTFAEMAMENLRITERELEKLRSKFQETNQ